MKDSYKVKVIQEILDNMDEDYYYLAQLTSADTKNINLDKNALLLLKRYYETDEPVSVGDCETDKVDDETVISGPIVGNTLVLGPTE